METNSKFFGSDANITHVSEFATNLLSFDTADGYTVYSYYRLSGSGNSWTNFDKTVSLTINKKYDFYFLVTLPENISKSTIFNMSLDIYKSGLKSFGPGSVVFSRPNSSQNFSSDDFTMETVGTNNNRYMTDTDITASCDADRFSFYFSATGSFTGNVSVYPVSISIEEVSEQGLLGGIIETLVSLPSAIADNIKGFFDNIVNAVVNLGTTILDGIKSLFVPSQNDITSMKSKWDTLLSNRFGALYEVFDIISDYSSNFIQAMPGNDNTITFPTTSLNFSGVNWTFGGWTVPIVPEGFNFLIVAVKTMSSIGATFMFVNALNKRYDRIIGGTDV